MPSTLPLKARCIPEQRTEGSASPEMTLTQEASVNTTEDPGLF